MGAEVGRRLFFARHGWGFLREPCDAMHVHVHPPAVPAIPELSLQPPGVLGAGIRRVVLFFNTHEAWRALLRPSPAHAATLCPYSTDYGLP